MTARRHPALWAVLAAVVVGIGIAVGSATGAEDVSHADPVPSSSATLAVTDGGSAPAEPGPAAADATDVPPSAPPGPADVTPGPAPDSTPGTRSSQGAANETEPGSALAVVADLAVKGRAPRTGYSRDQFGPAWADVDRNGCDTRNDILNRDLVDVVTREGTHGCVVLTGTLHDPYSGETMTFERGEATSSLVQIDHVVPLSDAWQKGAQQWSPETRRQFGNDPLNLVAVQGSLNQQKSDGDTATWLPPNKAARCPYVARQVAVKRAYGLWVTQAERDAMVRVLTACPDEPLPTGGLATVPPGDAAPVPAPADDPAQPAEVYFPNCAAARAAGAAPLHVGDPGFRRAMDGDGDGVACE